MRLSILENGHRLRAKLFESLPEPGQSYAAESPPQPRSAPHSAVSTPAGEPFIGRLTTTRDPANLDLLEKMRDPVKVTT